jgi:hypothetical protein
MSFVAPGITALNSRWLSKDNTGLGNVMFQVATAYGLARRTNRQFSSYFLKQFTDKLQQYYGLPHGEGIYKGFLKGTDSTTPPTATFVDTGGKKYIPTLEERIRNSQEICIQLEGHFESPQYFHEFRQDLLQLVNVSAYKDLICSQIPDLFNSSYTPIAVHIRNAVDAVKFGFLYYKNAVEHIKQLVPNPWFFLFIDDPNSLPIHPHALGMQPFTFVHFPVDFLDLYAMSYCSHFILSNSTFAWWGSYLSEFPEKYVLISRAATEFSKQANHMTEEEFRDEYFLGNVAIIPD